MLKFSKFLLKVRRAIVVKRMLFFMLFSLVLFKISIAAEDGECEIVKTFVSFQILCGDVGIFLKEKGNLKEDCYIVAAPLVKRLLKDELAKERADLQRELDQIFDNTKMQEACSASCLVSYKYGLSRLKEELKNFVKRRNCEIPGVLLK